LDAYAAAARRYAEEFTALSVEARLLPDAHVGICRLAERWLPTRVDLPEDADADAQ